MGTDVDVVNKALVLLGEKRISSLLDDVKPAREANAIYANVRDSLLTNFNWIFAMARGRAILNATAPIFGYGRAYDLPADCFRLVLASERYVGAMLDDFRGVPVEEFALEGAQILTDWGPDGSDGESGGAVTGLVITNPGWGLLVPPTIAIAAPGGGGVTALATSYLGIQRDYNIWDSFGAGYTFGDRLGLVGGVTVQQAEVKSLNAGVITQVQPYVPGKYTTIPGTAVYIPLAAGTRNIGLATLAGTGAGAAAGFLWGMSGYVLTNPGTRYATVPVVTVTHAGGGTEVYWENPVVTATIDPLNLANEFINVRYVRQVTDASLFTPSFVDVLAAQLAEDLAEVLTQSNQKKLFAEGRKKDALRKAIRSNAIQLPPVRLPDDDWMLSRV